MKIIIIVILALGFLTAGYLLEKPAATVTTPEVKQTGDYRRPVREGNCYRHFTPTGTVLACG